MRPLPGRGDPRSARRVGGRGRAEQRGPGSSACHGSPADAAASAAGTVSPSSIVSSKASAAGAVCRGSSCHLAAPTAASQPFGRRTNIAASSAPPTTRTARHDTGLDARSAVKRAGRATDRGDQPVPDGPQDFAGWRFAGNSARSSSTARSPMTRLSPWSPSPGRRRVASGVDMPGDDPAAAGEPGTQHRSVERVPVEACTRRRVGG